MASTLVASLLLVVMVFNLLAMAFIYIYIYMHGILEALAMILDW